MGGGWPEAPQGNQTGEGREGGREAAGSEAGRQAGREAGGGGGAEGDRGSGGRGWPQGPPLFSI